MKFGAFRTVVTGELAGSATAVQMPDIESKLVKFKANADNAGNVHIGSSSSVTVAAGTTTTTAGLQLAAGDETGWLPIPNLSLLYRICDNAGDDLTYLVLR